MRRTTWITQGMLALGALGLFGCQADSGGPITAVDPNPAQFALQTVEVDGVHLVMKPGSHRLAPATIAVAVIGSAGGSISADSGTLFVPAGALSVPVTITMEGSTTNIWKYLFGPSGLGFAAPATLEIAVDPSMVGDDGVTLKVAGSDELGLEWEIIQGSYYDADRGVVTAPIHHFSQYAICIE